MFVCVFAAASSFSRAAGMVTSSRTTQISTRTACIFPLNLPASMFCHLVTGMIKAAAKAAKTLLTLGKHTNPSSTMISESTHQNMVLMKSFFTAVLSSSVCSRNNHPPSAYPSHSRRMIVSFTLRAFPAHPAHTRRESPQCARSCRRGRRSRPPRSHSCGCTCHTSA